MDKQKWRPNAHLKRARELRGWSQEDLAGKIGTTQKIVSRWERGESTPVPYYRQRLCKLFEKNAAELGFLDGQTQNAAYSLHEGTLLQTRQEADLESADVNRREFLHETEQAAIGLIGAEFLERFYRALKKPSTLDGRLLSYLQLRTESYWHDRHGAVLTSHDLLDYVLDHFQKISRLLDEPMLPSQRIELCSIASKTAQLAGHLFFDLGDYSEARRFHQAGIIAAQEADSYALQATAWGRISFTWTYSRNAQEALRCVQKARHLAEGNVPDMVQAYLAAVEAEIQAILGDRVACLKALEKAECIEHQERLQEDSHWLRFDRSRLEGYKGICFRHLYRPEDTQTVSFLTNGQNALKEALARLAPGRIQRQPVLLIDLASTYILQGDIETACEYAIQAIPLTDQIKSQAAFRRLLLIRQSLQPWQHTSHVKNLDSQIAKHGFLHRSDSEEMSI